MVFRILSTRSKYATVPSNMTKVFVSYNTAHRVENGDPQKFGFKSFHKNRSKRQQLSRNFIQIPVLQLLRNQCSCRRPYENLRHSFLVSISQYVYKSDFPKWLIVLGVVPSSLSDRTLLHSHPPILVLHAITLSSSTTGSPSLNVRIFTETNLKLQRIHAQFIFIFKYLDRI